MRPIADVILHMPRPILDSSQVYVEPETPVCPVCKGAGWLRTDVPVGHPSFNLILECDCQKGSQNRTHAAARRRNSHLDGLESKTFDNFEADRPNQRDALNAARTLARDLQSWLVLEGSVGTGKTHLAAAIANEVLEMTPQSVMFTVVPDLLDHLRAAYAPSSEITYDERFNAIRDTFLLVLDDLGTENTTPWAQEKLYQIVNHRYKERLPTVITTNRPASSIDERILSRMRERGLSIRIDMTGEDYRRRGDATYVKGKRQ